MTLYVKKPIPVEAIQFTGLYSCAKDIFEETCEEVDNV